MSIATRAGPGTRPATPPGADPSTPAREDRTLRVRWLGRVDYRDAHALQHGLHSSSPDDHLLLLEHPHVFTLGCRADPTHVLVDPAAVGADMVRTDRGGDVTYHGPGQLVGYPVLSVPGRRSGGMADTVAYVRSVEQVVIDALARLGVTAGRLRRYPGVWVDPDGAAPRKIAAIGVRLTRGRSMHGFALNVDPDLSYFDHIVPCGIADKDVTSIAAEGAEADMKTVVDAIAERAAAQWAPPAGGSERTWCGGVGPRISRRSAGATGRAVRQVRASTGAPRSGWRGVWPRPASPAVCGSPSGSRSGCGPRSGWARRSST